MKRLWLSARNKDKLSDVQVQHLIAISLSCGVIGGITSAYIGSHLDPRRDLNNETQKAIFFALLSSGASLAYMFYSTHHPEDENA